MKPLSLVALGGLVSFVLHGCGSSSGTGLGSTPDGGGGGDPGGGFSASTGGAPAGGGGASASTGGAPACTGASCPPTNPGSKAPGETCGGVTECASGRCEPLTGVPGRVCLGACFADGAPCTRALDCCSTGCQGGTCGGLCTLENESCSSDAECCSNLCQGGECQIDEVNRDCRPTGEDCTSGTGRGCCNECDDTTDRCAFGSNTCFAQGVACTANSDCCGGNCANGTCRTPCVANGDACTAATDCCSSQCSAAGTCGPPPPVAGPDGGTSRVCTPIGERCVDAADCCTTRCFGGFCDRALR